MRLIDELSQFWHRVLGRVIQVGHQFVKYDVVTPDYFGVNPISLRFGIPYPQLKMGVWRSFDSLWYRLQPQSDQWQLSEVDAEVDWCNRNGVKMSLILGNTPKWASARPNETGWFSGAPSGTRAEPASTSDWTKYVTTLATRYRGHVESFELWNEPNNFFSGTPAKLVELSRAAYEAVKSVDPRYIVISPCVNFPGGSSYMSSFLDAGGANTFDVLGAHMYLSPGSTSLPPRPPEELSKKVNPVRQLAASYGIGHKPIWNTESGYGIVNPSAATGSSDETFMGTALTDDQASAYIARSYIIAWWQGVRRFQWYSWGASGLSLVDPVTHVKKSCAGAYDVVRDWLVGNRMTSLAVDVSGTWSVTLARPDGSTASIVWNPSGSAVVGTRPGSSSRDLSGSVGTVTGSYVVVSGSPVMLED